MENSSVCSVIALTKTKTSFGTYVSDALPSEFGYFLAGVVILYNKGTTALYKANDVHERDATLSRKSL